MSSYEKPTVTELGSVADFTRGDGFRGDHDNITFTLWGYDFSFDYGQPTS